jgi:hypothetical protein
MKNQTFLKHVSLGYDGRTGHRQKNSNLSDSVIRSEKIRNYALVRRSGWCQYSRNSGWFINRLFLVGKDSDSGWFVVQVPSTLETVEQALDWMKPAAVRKAKTVKRQGDWFFYSTKRKPKGFNLNDSSHQFRYTESGIEVFHMKGEHNCLILPGHNWQAAQRKAITSRGD